MKQYILTGNQTLVDELTQFTDNVNLEIGCIRITDERPCAVFSDEQVALLAERLELNIIPKLQHLRKSYDTIDLIDYKHVFVEKSQLSDGNDEKSVDLSDYFS